MIGIDHLTQDRTFKKLPVLMAKLGDAIDRVAMKIGAAQERARQRRALAALNDDLLKDIGVSRAMAEYEADKAFWRR